jgi:hypothetical protein
MPERIFIKFGVYIIEPEPISTDVLHKSLPSARVPIFFARKRLGKRVPAATIEELLETSFSVRSKSY